MKSRLPCIKLRNASLIVLLVIISVIDLQAQKFDYEALIKKSDSLILEREYQKALYLLKNKLVLSGVVQKPQQLLTIHNGLASCYLGLVQLEKAKLELDKAFNIVEEAEKELSVFGDFYFLLAEYYKLMSEYKQSSNFYTKALENHKNTLPEGHEDIVRDYLGLVYIAGVRSQFELSLKYLEAAYKNCIKNPVPNQQNLAQYYSHKGKIRAIHGDNDEAIRLIEKAISIFRDLPYKHDQQLTYQMALLSVIYYNAANYGKALEISLEVLPLYNKIFGPHHLKTGVFYGNLARIYSRLGEYSKALEYNLKSLSIAQTNFGETHHRVGAAYRSLAATYYRKVDYENALMAYQKAIDNYEIVFDGTHKDLCHMYGSMGRIQSELGNYAIASEHFTKSLLIGKRVFGQDQVFLSYTYQDIGKNLMRQTNFKGAENYLFKSLDIRKKAYGAKHWEVGITQQAIIELYTRSQDYTSALEQADSILTTFDIELQEALKEEYTEVEYHILRLLLETLHDKSKILMLQFEDSRIAADLQSALENNIIADRISQKIRQRISLFKDKIKLVEINNQLYDGAISASLAAWSVGRNQQERERAFYYSERSRANTLYEFTVRNNAKNLEDPLGILLEQEASLKTSQSQSKSRISALVDGGDEKKQELEEEKSKLFSLKIRHDSILMLLQREYPNYMAMSGREFKSIPALQNQIDPQTTLIEYYHQGDSTYVFIISKSQYKTEVLNTKGIENRIKAFHNAIQTKNTDEFKSQGREVYRQLLAPFKDELKAKELIIIPHGPLWNLNFDLLLTADTNSNNPAEFPYLLKEYAISYGNSAQMLFNISDNSSITRAQCLAFSYTDEQEMAVADRGSLDQLRSTRGDLPGSREEIKAIATYVSGLYFFGEEATKWRFKENSGEFGILHLALHGELNEEDPEQSRLIFSDLNEEEEDNFLYSHEISTMRLPAELGVLSACDTGAGEIITGEGIMSLGNAFQYAGTRSLLLSRWPASDETTAAIMNYFYKNMSKGMSKALALQKAKKEYLTSVTGQKSHPFYWGGFYVLGSNAPIELKGRTAWFFPAVGLSLALLGFILIGKARRRRVAA